MLRLVRRTVRHSLVAAVSLIVLVSILPSVGPRLLRSPPHNRGVRLPVREDDEQPAGGGSAATVQESQAVGIASASGAAARTRGRAAFRHLRRGLYWLAVAAVSVALVAILAIVGARLFGYYPHIMHGGSMGSAAPLGSVAFIEDVPTESLNVGDVIVFRPPSSGEAPEPLMHRIVSIEEVDGQRVFSTKGDANGSADPWELRLTGEGGRLVFFVPYVGYLLWFLQTPIAWAALILPLAACLGFVALRRIWAPAASRSAPSTRAR
jgi:signal peptidase